MGLLNLFKLEKLKIKVYEKRRRMGGPKATIEVMFNPESYSFSYDNVFTGKQSINSSGKPAVFSVTKPSELSLKLIFDGTGVSEYGITNIKGGKKDVYARVQEFLKMTSTMNGNTHEPNFLKVEWGRMHFKCRLQKVDINYTLFDSGGVPLRAELDTVFI